MDGKPEDVSLLSVLKKKNRENRMVESDKYEFEVGRAYLVKALDHFTSYRSRKMKMFIEFLGIFREEIKDYYIFTSLIYEEHTTEEEFYTPELRHVVKCSVDSVQPLNLWIKKEIKFKPDSGADVVMDI